MSPHDPLSLCKDNIILNIKPQNQIHKIFKSKQDKKPRLSLKNKYLPCYQFSFVYLGILTNYLDPQRFISHLRQLKAIKYLTLDLTYLLQIPSQYIAKIFISLKYLKNLSVLQFELTRISYLTEPNLHALCQAIPILNNLPNPQINFSLDTSRMTAGEKSNLCALFESFNKLKRFTSVSLNFLRYIEIASIVEVIGTLRASKSLAKFSLTLENCTLNRFHELFYTISEIKSLKNSRILLKECEVPHYVMLKNILPFVKEVGEKGDLTVTFENYRHLFKKSERLLFTKEIQKIKPSCKIQVEFIEKFRIVQKFKSLYQQGLASYRDMGRAQKIYYLILIFIIIGMIILFIFVLPDD